MTDVKDGDVVETREVSTTVAVRAWRKRGVESEFMYDWTDSEGRESDQLFSSIQEALEDYS